MMAVPKPIFVGDIVESNGKTWRENNLAIQHKVPVGALVEVEVDDYGGAYFRDGAGGWRRARWNEETEENPAHGETWMKGTARLFVVAHRRDCDGSPLYTLAKCPVNEWETVPPEVAFGPDIMKRILAQAMYEIHNGYGEDSLKVVALP